MNEGLQMIDLQITRVIIRAVFLIASLHSAWEFSLGNNCILSSRCHSQRTVTLKTDFSGDYRPE